VSYDGRVTDTPLSPATLAAALERLQLRPAAAPNVAAATHGQFELTCARIASVTELLRRETDWTETTRVAARLLLADVGAASAYVRADANESAQSLTRTIDSIRSLLDRTDS